MTRDEHLAAAEANAREAYPTITDEMVEAFLALQTARIDGIERVRAGLAAVVPLIRAQVAAERRCVLCSPGSPEEIRQREEASAELDRLIEPDEPVADVRDEFNAQVAEALRRLDGSTASAVALLTGMSRDEIDQVGGVTSDGGDDRG